MTHGKVMVQMCMLCVGGWALDFEVPAPCQVPESMTKNLEDDFYKPAVAAYEYAGKYYGVLWSIIWSMAACWSIKSCLTKQAAIIQPHGRTGRSI